MAAVGTRDEIVLLQKILPVLTVANNVAAFLIHEVNAVFIHHPQLADLCDCPSRRHLVAHLIRELECLAMVHSFDFCHLSSPSYWMRFCQIRANISCVSECMRVPL